MLVGSNVVRCTLIAYQLIRRSHAIQTHTAEKAESLVLSTHDEPILSVITDFFLSSFSF